MPFSVSLSGNTPSPRYGDAPGPWTQVRWEQASARSGPWTAVEMQTLDPVDVDPSKPKTWDLTSELITTYPGWLRLVWLDADGAQEPTEPVFVGSAIRPAVVEVANLMPDRTTLEDGTDAGTFTGDTRPTATQVDALIDMVLDTIESEVAAGASSKVRRAARSIVALQAAILTEATYFSHQGEVNTARIELWERLVERHSLTLEQQTAQGSGAGRGRLRSIRLTTGIVEPEPASELP